MIALDQDAESCDDGTVVDAIVAVDVDPVASLVSVILPVRMRVTPNGAGIKVPVVIGGRVPKRSLQYNPLSAFP